MVYRHIYNGLLEVIPGPENCMTDAAKPTSYLVRIITPEWYISREEAARDELEYCFRMDRKGPCLVGLVRDGMRSRAPENDGSGNEEGNTCLAVDWIGETDWDRYQMIRLNDRRYGIADTEKMFQKGSGKPCRRPWRKLVPAFGCYPIIKKSGTVIAFPDVEGGTEDAGSGKQGP